MKFKIILLLIIVVNVATTSLFAAEVPVSPEKQTPWNRFLDEIVGKRTMSARTRTAIFGFRNVSFDMQGDDGGSADAWVRLLESEVNSDPMTQYLLAAASE